MIDKLSRLLVIHGNRLFRECLSSVLKGATGIDATAISGSDIASYEKTSPTERHMVLIDLDLPDNRAIELTRHMLQQWIDCRVIILASLSSQEKLVDCIEAGAHGCVIADASIEELETAMRQVMRGETYCSAGIVQSVFVQFAKLSRESRWRERVKSFDLTPRELEILQLISSHLSNKQIAKRLTVSLFTVKNHVHKILQKLKVTSRFEAVSYARSNRWLEDVPR